MASPSVYEKLLAAREVVIVCGPGGVGKTTVAAASALLAAQHLGGRVLVLTVDPARRLATSLGLDSLGNAERQIDPGVLASAGISPRGELWAAQLDTRQAWDDLIGRHAPDRRTEAAILANSLYENVTGTFVHSHDYIAMERLHELHTSGRYDLIVVDTPPSRRAIDFLEAPERMAEFFSSRLLRWLTVPYRSRIFTAASKPFYSAADRLLGRDFLRDIADFFLLFQTMYGGFVERAEEVERTMRSRRTAFVVVSTLESASVSECSYFVEELSTRRLQLGSVVLNRVLPDIFGDRECAAAARKLITDAHELAVVFDDVGDPGLVAQVLREIGESFLDYGVTAARQQELRAALTEAPPLPPVIPHVAEELVDVTALTTIVDALRR